MTHRTSLIAAALSTTALLAGWTFAQPTRTTTPAAPPAASTGGLQYALLTHYDISRVSPGNVGNWRFEDAAGVYNSQQLAKQFGLQPGDEGMPARIITAIAARGWELVTHTDAVTTVPSDIREGTTFATATTTRIEQWWFKKR
ncbi:MAG: hypothetical protein QM783_19890 [Phycisphaerales bacterium]